VLALLISVLAFSQDFEGTITWAISMEITDPALKKKMENANKELSSPQNQAQIKELQKQLNDPQYKAMFDQNPQMKDMLEKQLAAMSGGGASAGINSMVPKSIEVKIKGGNSLVKTIGGMFESEILYLKDKDRTFTLDRKNKSYSSRENKPTDSQGEFKVTKTEEFLGILTYKCRKYIIESTEKGQKITYFVWSTTDIKNIDTKQLSKIRLGRSENAAFISKVDGMPLKIQAANQDGNMTMEVTALKKELHPAELFVIPAGFTEKKSNY